MPRYRLTLDFDCVEEFPEINAKGEAAIEEVFDVLPPPEQQTDPWLRLRKLTELSN